MLDVREFTTKGDAANLPKGKQLEQAIHKALVDTLSRYSTSRIRLEDTWSKEYYAYATTKEAKRNLTSVAKQVIGKTKVKWRHMLKSPKAYETVETITSYLMGAFFPNQKWFDFAAAGHTEDPNFRTVLELNRKFINKKLEDADFRDVYRMLMREVCITGTAALMFPWHEAQQNSKFNVLSCYEFWLDPTAQHVNEANLIRKYTLHKAEVIANKEFFDLANTDEINGSNTIQYDRGLMRHLRHMQGIDVYTSEVQSDDVHIFEFWGDLLLPDHSVILENVRATFTLDSLYNFMNNPFVHRPIAVFNYTQMANNPYGMSAIQAVLPQLYYKDVMASRFADAVVSSADPTYVYMHDGVVNPDEVFIAPGHRIAVTQKDAISPVPLGGDMRVSIQDMTIVEQTIDKSTGTGPFIGVGQGRAAERVTKAEIDAQVAAGGNRLNDVYDHIQHYLLRFLKWYRDYFRYYFTSVEQIEVRQLNKSMEMFNQELWANVDVNSFQFDVEIKPLGASNVATKEFKLRQLFEWMSVVGQNPDMAQQVDWNQVLQHITFTMLPDEASFFLAPPPQQVQPTNPVDQLTQTLEQAGAGADIKALQSQAMAGALPQTIQQLTPQL